MSSVITDSPSGSYPAWKQDPHATKPPYSDPSPPEPVTPPAPYNGPAPEDTGHPWRMWGGLAPTIVSGGSVSVDTADLDALSSSLTSAAGSLDDARTLIATAVTEVNAAPPPPLPPISPFEPRSLLNPQGTWDDVDGQCVPAPDPAILPSFPTQDNGLSSQVYPFGLDLEKSAALQSLTALSTGPGSLQDAADTLRGIASDVIACSQAHTLAEGGATPGPGLVGPVDIRAFDGGLAYQALGLGISAAVSGPTGLATLLTTPGSPLYAKLAENEDGQAVAEALHLLLADPATAQWVKDDAVRIVLLTLWLQKARTGRESATIEAYLKQVSERLDPWVTQHLPGQLPVGTRTVDTTSLTPMQRVTAYLGMNATALGAGLYGRQTGITVTPVGGSGSTVLPPATKDPLGLGSPVQAGMIGKGKDSRSPQSISETITHCQELQASRGSLGQDYEEAGVISIQRVEHADGRVSWVVYVPGTTDWTVGDGEPQDLLTNLEGVGGTPTAMESAVVTAMRQAGIQPGEEVALYGHSQGGITVSNIAADPAIQDRYNITTVLTAGSPTAGADIPADVHALHLENAGDAVPGLDAAPTPTGPHRQIAMLDTHQMDMGGYPHASDVYAQATEGLEERAPELADWRTSFSHASGAGEQGATTTEYTFAVQRDTDSSGVYKDATGSQDTGYQGKVPSSKPSYELPTPAPQPSGEH
ncbi:hypothetical protein BKH05_06640 [Actinomyces naeslundii]|uniref:hypothetical protein n=1 Tax=Actinomyces naeslundii TaxID=1655 RepID=UPI00097B2A56|nr:hypothetical protein [Actinomyces naeslundii]OMG21209.1 hypothetical protein BKH05_06640 [Actinomyces naeslundii]